MSFSSSSGEDSDELDGDAYSQLLQQVAGKRARVERDDDIDYESDSGESSGGDGAVSLVAKQALIAGESPPGDVGTEPISEEENALAMA